MAITEVNPKNELPQQWKLACERDHAGKKDYAGPAPERHAGKMLAPYILTGFFFFTLPGTFLGVRNLIAITDHEAKVGASTAWIQTHGHAQLLGWVASFIIGISFYVLPKFRGHQLKRYGVAWVMWAMWTLGVGHRRWASVVAERWRAALVTSAVLGLAAFVVFEYAVYFPRPKDASAAKQKKPVHLGSWLGIFGLSALGVALIVNLLTAVSVALHRSAPVYPAAADQAFLIIVIWGFALLVAWGYSTKFVTIFLGLRQPSHRMAP